jgi:P4 family phage/plasmid primase-like protien
MPAMFDAASSGAPLANDPDAVRAHVELIHRLAGPLAGKGKLVITAFGEDPDQLHPKTGKPGCPRKPIVVHVGIGDIDTTVETIVNLATQQHYNVYMPLAVFRPDLPAGKKGAEKDIVAVLGLVPDFDDREAARWAERLPIPPSYVLETSNGRFQPFCFFDKPERFEDVKQVAERLKAFAHCDHGTADLSHVWRIPGTLNWPNSQKVAAGRVRQPQVVKVVMPWAGGLVALADLAAALPAPEAELSDNMQADGIGTDEEPGIAGDGESTDTLDTIMRNLPAGLLARIRGPASGDRSRRLFYVIGKLVERGVADTMIERVIRAHPAGVGLKYINRDDLDKEIARIRSKISLRASANVHHKADSDPRLADWLSRFLQNDIGNAERLRRRFGDRLRYVVNIGWFAWDGRRWQRDEDTIVARCFAQRTSRAIFHECAFLADGARKGRASWAITSASTSRLSAMLSEAEPHLALHPKDLDRDPWLFNVANGTLDLRTGGLRPHRRDDFLTSVSPIPYDAGAKCPTWERFLNEIFAGDINLIEFVQRAGGYSMTGLTREHVLFICHGLGSNGKSVLIEIIAAVLADYAQQCPTDTFMVKDRGGTIPNDIARLRGARFVSAVETEGGRRLAESLVKQATGGDRLTARFLHREFFEFIPTFKLWLATNHRPEIRGTDNGIWRRIRMIPFGVTFKDPGKAGPGDLVKDDRLADKLRTELTGILAWLVRGCVAWRKDGLMLADAVSAATATYREEQDVLAHFLAERCETAPNYVARAADLYKNYSEWAEANGEKPISSTAFGLQLKERSFRADRGTAGVRVWLGIDLKEEFKFQNQRASNYD